MSGTLSDTFLGFTLSKKVYAVVVSSNRCVFHLNAFDRFSILQNTYRCITLITEVSDFFFVTNTASLASHIFTVCKRSSFGLMKIFVQCILILLVFSYDKRYVLMICPEKMPNFNGLVDIL